MLDEVSGPAGPSGLGEMWAGDVPGGGGVRGGVAGLGPDGVELLTAAVEEVRAGVEAGYKAIEQVGCVWDDRRRCGTLLTRKDCSRACCLGSALPA